MKKEYIIVALVALVWGSVQAQGLRVSGMLQEAASGQVLPYTNCVLLRQSDSLFVQGTTTDSAGIFRFSAVDTGAYLLRVSAVGYAPYWQEVDLPADTVLGTIGLFASLKELQTVTVRAQRPLYSADGEKVFYHVEDDPSVQTGTMADALQNAPGVEVDAEGNISYRGKTAVEVWINDRPSNMDGEALKQYIKSLPASSIKRIEVLGNPSARYGTSGSIINIVTEGKAPLNQLLCLGFKASTGPRLSPWVSYIYSNDKLNISLYGNAFFNNFNITMENHQQMFVADSVLSQSYDYTGSEKQRSRQCSAGGNLDYRFDDRNQFSAWMWFYPSSTPIAADFDVSRIEYLFAPGDYSYHSDIDTRSLYIGGNVGAYYRHKFDTSGRQIEFNWNGGLSSRPFERTSQRRYAIFPQLDFTRHILVSQTESRHNLTINYTHPYSKSGTIEAGVDVRYETQDYARMFDTLAEGVYRRDSVRSCTFVDRVPEVTGYITVQQKIERLTLKGGLRVGNAWLHREHNIASCDFSKRYLSLVPSIHASYATQNNHNFTLSYTRRFGTPNVGQLTPFIVYGDDSYSVGNPDLRMSYSHNAEVGWTHYTQWGSIGVEAYLNLSTDNIGNITDVVYSPFFGRMVEKDSAVNVGNVRHDGVELNLTWRPRKFMNIRLYAGCGEGWYRLQLRPGQWVEDQVFNYNVRLNMSAKLWGKVDVFANGRFTGRQIEYLSRTEPSFNVDLGLSTDLLNRHLSLYLRVTDLFQSSNMHTISTNPYYSEDYRWSYNSRYISLGLTWRIGKMELERQGRQGAAY